MSEEAESGAVRLPPLPKLFAALDSKTGCVVLHTANGDIRLFVADGKMDVVRREAECGDCVAANLRFAEQIAATLAEQARPDELPAHHPLMDARQSARLLVAALAQHRSAPAERPGAESGIRPYPNNPGRWLSDHRPGLNFPSYEAAYADKHGTPAEQPAPAKITWDEHGRRLVNGELASEHKQPAPAESGAVRLPPLPEPSGEIFGRRLTPKDTSEFWGYFADGHHTDKKHQVFTAEQMQAYARAAIAEQARPEREGWQWVPKEPTPDMILAAHSKIDWCRDGQNTQFPVHSSQVAVLDKDGNDTGLNAGSTCEQDIQDAWRAALAASPQPQDQEPT